MARCISAIAFFDFCFDFFPCIHLERIIFEDICFKICTRSWQTFAYFENAKINSNSNPSAERKGRDDGGGNH
jgi:hypothetical protein